MNYLPATLLCDFYKISHREQYPDKTQLIYSTWTPRETRIKGIDQVVVFGIQGFIQKYLINYFTDNFFNIDMAHVLADYERVLKHSLGIKNPDTSHIEALHSLGYLPLLIKALPEGSLCPIRIPMLTVQNTKDEFFWLTNYIETLMSCQLWQPCTSATLSLQYRKLLDRYAMETVGNNEHVKFQGHDFSMRGMSSLESACLSGSAHLTSFVGTDSIPAILYLEEYYNTNIEKELVGTSIPATEHSVMCAHGQDEYESFRHIVEDVYPDGLVSIVSDTWDLWEVINNVIRKLKPSILRRNGKVVLRPDSGDPVKIICGDDSICHDISKRKGVIELLWDIFGGTTNALGYKELDSHIGAIYGDAITLERCEEICQRLKDKGFASSNIVFGIGSFTYQYNTRDTFGFAMKSTLCVIDGKEHLIFKDPVTDNGVKKSLKGAVYVDKREGVYRVQDGLSIGDFSGYLRVVFKNGKAFNIVKLKDIRSALEKEAA
ncbi:MAG: nicotinate phosphoribosyltransferase [Candidatus Anammoxibacter sp.]